MRDIILFRCDFIYKIKITDYNKSKYWMLDACMIQSNFWCKKTIVFCLAIVEQQNNEGHKKLHMTYVT
jgi:hypothetical protein